MCDDSAGALGSAMRSSLPLCSDRLAVANPGIVVLIPANPPQQFDDAAIGDAIKDLPATLPTVEQTVQVQPGEVLADGVLRLAELTGQVIDRQGARRPLQPLQQTDANRVRRDAQSLHGLLKGSLGNPALGCGSLHDISIYAHLCMFQYDFKCLI